VKEVIPSLETNHTTTLQLHDQQSLIANEMMTESSMSSDEIVAANMNENENITTHPIVSISIEPAVENRMEASIEVTSSKMEISSESYNDVQRDTLARAAAAELLNPVISRPSKTPPNSPSDISLEHLAGQTHVSNPSIPIQNSMDDSANDTPLNSTVNPILARPFVSPDPLHSVIPQDLDLNKPVTVSCSFRDDDSIRVIDENGTEVLSTQHAVQQQQQQQGHAVSPIKSELNGQYSTPPLPFETKRNFNFSIDIDRESVKPEIDFSRMRKSFDVRKRPTDVDTGESGGMFSWFKRRNSSRMYPSNFCISFEKNNFLFFLFFYFFLSLPSNTLGAKWEKFYFY